VRLKTYEQFDPKVGRKVQVYEVNGRRVTKAQYEKAAPKKLGLAGRGKVKGVQAHHLIGQHPAGWPFASDALGVHPQQIELAKKRDRDRGAPPTEYTKIGQPIMQSPSHMRAFLKAHKYHHRNSFS
jgi:hypothetical protein